MFHRNSQTIDNGYCFFYDRYDDETILTVFRNCFLYLGLYNVRNIHTLLNFKLKLIKCQKKSAS